MAKKSVMLTYAIKKNHPLIQKTADLLLRNYKGLEAKRACKRTKLQQSPLCSIFLIPKYNNQLMKQQNNRTPKVSAEVFYLWSWFPAVSSRIAKIKTWMPQLRGHGGKTKQMKCHKTTAEDAAVFARRTSVN